MDLDEEELAVYLHLTPQQVKKLADRSQIPGRKVSGSWRFSEAEIHSWLEARIGASSPEQLPKMQQVVQRWANDQDLALGSLVDLTSAEAIEVPLRARTRSSVVRRICSLAEKTGLLWDVPRMIEAVLAREDLHPTALDNGVALLHPRRPQASILGGPLLAIGISAQPIPFGNRSGHLTDVFFLICSTEDKLHLQVLAKLSRLIGQSEFLQGLRTCQGVNDVMTLLESFEAELDEENEANQ